jgi:hypothetical protein
MAKTSSRPNFLLFITDQQRADFRLRLPKLFNLHST